MTDETFIAFLSSKGFIKDTDEEYHFDIYTSDKFKINVDGKELTIHLQVKLNYYNVGFIWWYKPNGKVSKMYYRSEMASYDEPHEMIESFIRHSMVTYNIDVTD